MKEGVNGTRGTMGVVQSQPHWFENKKSKETLCWRNEETDTYGHWFYFPKSNMYFKVGRVKLFFEQKLGHMVGQFIPCEIFIRTGLQSYKIKAQLINHLY